jgi:hypothetical protein
MMLLKNAMQALAERAPSQVCESVAAVFKNELRQRKG